MTENEVKYYFMQALELTEKIFETFETVPINSLENALAIGNVSLTADYTLKFTLDSDALTSPISKQAEL